MKWKRYFTILVCKFHKNILVEQDTLITIVKNLLLTIRDHNLP